MDVIIYVATVTAIQGFPGSVRNFPGSSQSVPEVPGLPRRWAPSSGKPDTLSWLTETFSVKEEGRGTRNGYEASKGSKGISGL